MSIVCCKVTEDHIEIASDSIGIRCGTQEKGNNKYAKLIEMNGMIIGGVGGAGETGLFQMFCETRKPKNADEFSVMSFFSEFLSWKQEKTKMYESKNQYILAFEGHAYYIEQNFFVREILTYEATGAGMDYALSALYLGHDVCKAVETSCELSIYCEKPIVLLKMDRAKA